MVGETTLNLIRDLNGYPTQGLPFSLNNQYFTLTANTAKSVTVPSGTADSYTVYMNVSSGVDVWVLPASSPTITLPNGTVTATKAELINPNFPSRTVLPGQTIQFISSTDGAAVSLQYYANLTTNNSF